jgi:hypothetical protein
MGALFSHGADFHRNFERAAYYVDRILKEYPRTICQSSNLLAMSWS